MLTSQILDPSGSAMSTSASTPTPTTAREFETALESYRAREATKAKVVVRFRAVGAAPVMKQNFFKISASNRFQTVMTFLRRELNWKSSDPLFMYINSSFSPAPDDTVNNLFKCFATEGHLIVNYSTTPAWG
ncbi:APG12-domain-containing protein [Atractiella rhizophila]|nr:APG12-domain-containing protein [Atractiella rhizophila]